jgi:CheY-like chemotaxis protein
MVIAQSAESCRLRGISLPGARQPACSILARPSMSSYYRPDSAARRARAGVDAQSTDHPPARHVISVVTGDAELASACARALVDAGYSVHTAVHSGHALLACLQGRRTDVLISELSMEEGSGPALARRLRKYNPELRALYIAKEGTLCDAENVLVRPFTREDLLQRVARLTSY